jgi:PAS domain S-box-containing protein
MGETGRGAAERIARRVSDLVGDGCIVRIADFEHGTLHRAAVAHRDVGRREQLGIVADTPQPLRSGWLGQAIAKNLAFRVEHAHAEEVVGAVAPFSAPVQAAIVAPLRRGGEAVGTVVALRDSVGIPYSLREQQLVEQLVLDEDEASVAITREPEAGRLLEHAAAGLWATDLDGVTTFVNEAASEMLGVPASELIGAPMADYLDEEPALIHARLSPRVETRDHRLVRPDRSEIWVSMTSTPLSDVDGRPAGTVSTLSEISERKRIEVALRLRAAAQEAVTELAEHALAGEDLASLMERAALSAADILGAEYVTIAEVAPGRDDVVPRVVLGWHPSNVGRHFEIPENSATDLCLDDDQPVVIGDYARVKAVRTGMMAQQVHARSAVCVSIAGGAGVFALTSPRADAFAGQDLSFLSSLAAVLSSRWRTEPAQLAAVPA